MKTVKLILLSLTINSIIIFSSTGHAAPVTWTTENFSIYAYVYAYNYGNYQRDGSNQYPPTSANAFAASYQPVCIIPNAVPPNYCSAYATLWGDSHVNMTNSSVTLNTYSYNPLTHYDVQARGTAYFSRQFIATAPFLKVTYNYSRSVVNDDFNPSDGEDIFSINITAPGTVNHVVDIRERRDYFSSGSGTVYVPTVVGWTISVNMSAEVTSYEMESTSMSCSYSFESVGSLDYYCDSDSDGYYSSSISGSCSSSIDCVPAGCQTSVGDDCNDGNNQIHPGATEVCDGADNDCNGAADDGLSSPTVCGVGACASTGTLSCQGGQMIDTCIPGVSQPEICNGMDDDCDGSVDDGIEATVSTCGTGSCAATGTLSCQDGQLINTCTPGSPSAEVCDNIDNDCDGMRDEQSCYYIYVSQSGNCGGAIPCFDSLQEGIDAALPDANIKVSQGTYNENISIIKSLVLQGGWDQSFTTKINDPALTIIDGDTNSDGVGDGHVISIIGEMELMSLDINNFTITHGEAPNGGGIYIATSNHCYSPDLKITDTIIAGNHASNSGGGLFAEDVGCYPYITLTNNIIHNNSAVNGGGIFEAASWSSIAMDIANSKVINNSASGLGGGVYVGSGAGALVELTMTNNIIADNSAINGGGIYSGSLSGDSSETNLSITNNTITGNSASSGGGLYLESTGDWVPNTADIVNSILWGNTGADVYIFENAFVPFTAKVNASFSDIGSVVNDPVHPGTYNNLGNNINVDPGFEDAENGDYHLSAFSLLIDTGTNTGAPAADIDGGMRPFDGDNDCVAKTDIGADEYMPTTGLWHEIPDNSTPDGRPFTSSNAMTWWYGQDCSGTYDTGQSSNTGSYITSDYTIATGARLTFWSWEGTENNPYYDLRKVYASADMGSTWQEILTLFGAENQWHEVDIPLDSYAGQSVRFKLTFDTVDSWFNNYPGWYVDDISVDCPTNYYRDSDGDGYGNQSESVQSCSIPSGYVTDNTDCNDSNYFINPMTFWYVDNDGDGYGNAAIYLQQCDIPEGPPQFVLNNIDYNDSNSTIGPPVKLTGSTTAYYSSIQDAYDAASSMDTIQILAVTTAEDLYVDMNKTVTIQGGYNSTFTSQSGTTTLQGSIWVTDGLVTIREVSLQ